MALIESVTITGATIYAVIRNSTGQVWNGSTFANYLDADWSTYPVPLTEQSPSGYYLVTAPAAVVAAGKTTFVIHQQLGGSPADTDPPIGSGTLGDVFTSYRLQELISASAGVTPPVIGSWIDKILNKSGAQTFDPTTDSLEALRDSGTGPTIGQIAAAVWDELLSGHVTAGSAGKALSDILAKMPAGAISTFDPTLSNVNLNVDQSGVVIGTINQFGGTALTQINDQVLDVIFTDTIPELTVVPGSTPTLAKAMMFLFMALRNKRLASTSEEKIHNTAGVAIATASISDDGTTAIKEQFG